MFWLFWNESQLCVRVDALIRAIKGSAGTGRCKYHCFLVGILVIISHNDINLLEYPQAEGRSHELGIGNLKVSKWEPKGD